MARKGHIRASREIAIGSVPWGAPWSLARGSTHEEEQAKRMKGDGAIVSLRSLRGPPCTEMELSNPSDRVSTLGLCITGSLSLHSSGQRTGDILDKIAATPSKAVVLYSICNLLNGLVL